MKNKKEVTRNIIKVIGACHKVSWKNHPQEVKYQRQAKGKSIDKFKEWLWIRKDVE